MTFENYIKGRLVDFVMNEAQSDGGLVCQLAVAQCLANRVHAGWHGGDWLKVIGDAPNVVGTTYSKRVEPDPRSMNFRELLRRIDDIYQGNNQNNIISAEKLDGDGWLHPLYYCEAHNINRAWFRENVLSDSEAHPYLAKVGQITFFG